MICFKNRRFLIGISVVSLAAFGILALAQQRRAPSKSRTANHSRSMEAKPVPPFAVGDPKVPLEDYLDVKDGADLKALELIYSSDQPDYPRLAEASELAQEYYNAKDGFAKKKVVDGLRAELEQKMQTWKTRPYFRFTFAEAVPAVTAYDFELGGFPLSFLVGTYKKGLNPLSPLPMLGYVEGEGIFFIWEHRIREMYLRGQGFKGGTIDFSNAGKFSVYKAADEARAREIDTIIRKRKLGKVTAYCFGQRKPNGNMTAQIMRVMVYDKAGNLLFEM